MRQPTAILSILLVLAVLTSGSGCQVLSIPSYRHAASGGLDCVAAGNMEAGCAEEYYVEEAECPTGILPPLPAWLSCWRSKKEASPPPYPRFHPLPTRPMFSPPPGSGEEMWPATFLP